jgi:hypothetical protein
MVPGLVHKDQLSPEKDKDLYRGANLMQLLSSTTFPVRNWPIGWNHHVVDQWRTLNLREEYEEMGIHTDVFLGVGHLVRASHLPHPLVHDLAPGRVMINGYCSDLHKFSIFSRLSGGVD